MKRIIESLSDPADHLALDEAALLLADDESAPNWGDTIRTWQFDHPVVVVGRSTRVGDEVDREFCEANDIPIFRRCSGGASIVGGPGCMMYSVVISLEKTLGARKIDEAHQYVMSRVLAAVRKQVDAATWQGTCDLTHEDRKFSGNSLRIARTHLLYHGTILFGSDLQLLARCLCHAPRQPDYRRSRDHHEFVTNVSIDPTELQKDLLEQFGVNDESISRLPLETIRSLRQQRYDNPDWHFRH